MILVVGATGFVGSEVCGDLAAKGKGVRALTRSSSEPSKVERLRGQGIEIAQGDLKDRDSLDRACRGADTIISTASSTVSRQTGDTLDSVDLQGQLNLIDAAYAAGASHFIYVSFSGGIDTDSPLRTAKRTVEDYLQGSGLTYTILRPTFFCEIWLSPHVGFDFLNGRAQIYGSGENKIRWISLKDVARYVVASVDNPAARNAVIELGGADDLSPIEVVRIFEEQSGRKFELQFLPVEALQQQKATATDPMQITFLALMLAYAKGDQIDRANSRKIFPDIRPSSVRDYARAVAGKA